MIFLTTKGVSIHISTSYVRTELLDIVPTHIFSYTIRIENLSNYPIQLLSRYWEIIEANGQIRHVEGEGVIGEQPFLYPGEFFEYTSGVDINSDFAKMGGHYLMENKFNNSYFQVVIPTFHLNNPIRLN
ncbi:MAG TPA: Co2+/Mg2+ efflux protein ApaG [Chitinophagaceae bacterium]|nr:Co2+/Mg2+ efflux protein ApaG [Chitinophagaceae bacterium]